MRPERAAGVTTLNIRGIDAEAVERIKRAARGLTAGEYLARVVELHLALCDALTPDKLPAELKRLGLEAVRTRV
jgi:hypothetical protein